MVNFIVIACIMFMNRIARLITECGKRTHDVAYNQVGCLQRGAQRACCRSLMLSVSKAECCVCCDRITNVTQ